MTILRVANRYFEFDESTFRESTTSGYFDSSYVSNGMATPFTSTTDTLSYMALVTAAVSTDYWIHFRAYPTTSGGGNDTNSGTAWLQLFNASGVLVADLVKNGNVAHDSKCRAYGTSTVTSTGSLAFTVNTAVIIDVHVNVSGSTTLVEVYANGVLAISATNTANGSRGLPVRAELRAANVGYTNFQQMNYSEIIIADTSTLGMRLDELQVNTVGANSDFTGTLSDLNVESVAGLTTTAAGQRHSWNPVAYAGSGAIAAVVASGRAHRKSGAPSKLAHYLRLGGVNYDGTDRTIDEYEAWQQIWATNPATSAAWVGSDLSSIQVGLKSAT